MRFFFQLHVGNIFKNIFWMPYLTLMPATADIFKERAGDDICSLMTWPYPYPPLRSDPIFYKSGELSCYYDEYFYDVLFDPYSKSGIDLTVLAYTYSNSFNLWEYFESFFFFSFSIFSENFSHLLYFLFFVFLIYFLRNFLFWKNWKFFVITFFFTLIYLIICASFNLFNGFKADNYFFLFESTERMCFFLSTHLTYIFSFSSYFFYDGYSFLVFFLFFIFLFLYFYFIFICFGYISSENRILQLLRFESAYYWTLFLLSFFFIFFVLLLPFAQDLFFFYFVLEGISFFLIYYFVCNYDRRIFVSVALKYYSLNALSSGSLLMSIVLIYTLIGSSNFFDIAGYFNFYFFSSTAYDILQPTEFIYLPLTCILSLFFFLIASGFKLTLFPFGLFLPSFLVGVSYNLILFFTVIFKFFFFFPWLKLLMFVYPGAQLFDLVFLNFGFLSMIFGMLGAFSQKLLKKFFAYTSINNMGAVALAVSFFTFDGVQTAFFFSLIYFISSILIFFTLTFLETAVVKSNKTSASAGKLEISTMNQLVFFREFSLYGFFFSVAVLSLAGFPPTAGFFAKFFLLLNLADTGNFIFIFLFLLINLISFSYYFRILRIVWLEPIQDLESYSKFVSTQIQPNLVSLIPGSFTLSFKSVESYFSYLSFFTYPFRFLFFFLGFFLFFFVFFVAWFTKFCTLLASLVLFPSSRFIFVF